MFNMPPPCPRLQNPQSFYRPTVPTAVAVVGGRSSVVVLSFVGISMSGTVVGISGPGHGQTVGCAEVRSSREVAEPRCVKIKFTFGKKSPSSPSEFEKGALVEATSDEKGFEGSWFTGKVIENLEDGKYLVEYLTLMTNDESGPLREEVHSRHIRPYPPHLPSAHLKLLDKVDAWYNDGWWEGVISKVLRGFKYVVYFALSNEELVFDLANLRPHQDWISGKWVLTV
ncbi:hypothetical protein MLD38_019610 [Melastoma candidum]|uniref:Uncharacterized protein n=1 Tax=Melastoma candidum TaxID=119954 RepID=A0ACB9QXM9_9MYRT|nr:hypothetical protein MLD38_019610 [Melastoma candidum]